MYNPQSLNRYSYALNNPIRYNDPTGHKPCSDEFSCAGKRSKPSETVTPESLLKKYNVTIDEKFSDKEKWAIAAAVGLVGRKIAAERNRNESGAEAFQNVYGAVHFQSGCGDDCRNKDKKGRAYGDEGGAFASGWQSNNGNGYFLIKVGAMQGGGGLLGTINMVHELGHTYDYVTEKDTGSRKSDTMPDDLLTRDSLRPNGYWYNGTFREDKNVFLWQMNTSETKGETFADTFVAWTFNAWNTDPANANAVKAAQDWMPHSP